MFTAKFKKYDRKKSCHSELDSESRLNQNLPDKSVQAGSKPVSRLFDWLRIKSFSFSILHLALIIAFCMFSCSCEEGTGPGKEEEPPAGPRNYTWVLDTLSKQFPYNSYYNIWGETADDIWVTGSTGDFSDHIIRFDGEKWEKVENNLYYDILTMTGTSSNDIWFAGSNGLAGQISHYDGSTFTTEEIKLEGYKDFWFINSYAESSQSVYVAGAAIKDTVYLDNQDKAIERIILHYNGNKWNWFEKPQRTGQFLRILKDSNDKYYLLELVIAEQDKRSIYQLENNKLKIIKSFHWSQFAFPVKLSDKIYFTWDNKLYKHESNDNFEYISNFENQQNQIPDYIGNKQILRIFGRSKNDFFFNSDAGLAHFNGKNFEILFPYSETLRISNALILEKEVFFVGWAQESGFYFCLRGYLNE